MYQRLLLKEAKHIRPHWVDLTFRDGFKARLDQKRLQMHDAKNLRWQSCRASADSRNLQIETKKDWKYVNTGRHPALVEVEAETLRYLADPEYAAEVRVQLDALRAENRRMYQELSEQTSQDAITAPISVSP